MPEKTKIQWCDSTVNPIMGCGGCELFPNGGEVLGNIDAALASAGAGQAKAKPLFRKLIDEAYSRIPSPGKPPPQGGDHDQHLAPA